MELKGQLVDDRNPFGDSLTIWYKSSGHKYRAYEIPTEETYGGIAHALGISVSHLDYRLMTSCVEGMIQSVLIANQDVAVEAYLASANYGLQIPSVVSDSDALADFLVAVYGQQCSEQLRAQAALVLQQFAPLRKVISEYVKRNRYTILTLGHRAGILFLVDHGDVRIRQWEEDHIDPYTGNYSYQPINQEELANHDPAFFVSEHSANGVVR